MTGAILREFEDAFAECGVPTVIVSNAIAPIILTTKCILATLLLLLLAVAIGSCRWGIYWGASPVWQAGILDGYVWWNYCEMADFPVFPQTVEKPHPVAPIWLPQLQIEGPPYQIDSVKVPLWIVIAALGVPAAGLWFASRRGRARAQSGKCRCGYDLTGNTSGRCPECGDIAMRAAPWH